MSNPAARGSHNASCGKTITSTKPVICSATKGTMLNAFFILIPELAG